MCVRCVCVCLSDGYGAQLHQFIYRYIFEHTKNDDDDDDDYETKQERQLCQSFHSIHSFIPSIQSVSKCLCHRYSVFDVDRLFCFF